MIERSIKNSGEKKLITFEDSVGREVVRSIDKTNCLSVLKEVMELESEKGSYDYDLRVRLLDLSSGELESWQVFIKDPNFVDKPPMTIEDYLDNPENWLPERSVLHEEIMKMEFDEIVKLSKRLGNVNPNIYILRGNTAAGKTTALGSHIEFERVINPDTSKPDGVINPDKYKSSLRKKLGEDGCLVTHNQVHIEGIMIKRGLYDLTVNAVGLSIVLDERFAYFQSILLVLSDARVTDRMVRILDLDVPLETSLIRVMGRDINGDDPIVNFDNVLQGFKGIRRGRKNVIDEVNTNPRITYYLLAESSDYPFVEVVEKNGNVFHRYDEVLYRKLIDFDTDDVERLIKVTIDEAYIDYVMSKVVTGSCPDKVRDRIYNKLRSNIGKTLVEVMA